MPRILVVTVDPPWPAISGPDLRNWQNISALTECGEVSVASLLPVALACPPTNSNVTIIGLTKDGEERRAGFSRRRTSIDLNIPKAAFNRLEALAHALRPDIAILEGIPLHPFLSLLRPLTPNLILDMHNIESDLAGQLRDLRTPSLKWLQAIADRDPERIRLAELSAVQVADSVWVCSEDDRRRLETFAGRAIRTHVVPNGVPRIASISEPIQPVERNAERAAVLFVGHLGYQPNIRAVRRLARGIMPLVRQNLPQSRLTVVGRSPQRALVRLVSNGGFDLVANPDDVSGYLSVADVVAVPLDVGGGTRLKILEAMAAGVPVVATPLAAEGLGLVDGVHISFASSDAEFATGIEALCRDPDRWHRQRENARKHVLNAYGPTAIRRAVWEGVGRGPDVSV